MNVGSHQTVPFLSPLKSDSNGLKKIKDNKIIRNLKTRLKCTDTDSSLHPSPTHPFIKNKLFNKCVYHFGLFMICCCFFIIIDFDRDF